MIAALHGICNQMSEAYHQGSSLVLLFDYDGTLTPIVEHPWQAELDTSTRWLLANLSYRSRVHVGILSGRRLDELLSLVRIPGIYYAGTGGLELEHEGFRIVHPKSKRMRSIMKRLAARLEDEVAAHEGASLEKKGLSLTIHYRHLPEELLGSLQAAVTDVTRDFAKEVRIVQGPRAWEISPKNGWNKGTAVRMILADFDDYDNVLFYAGDGANDAEAIAEVGAMSGITVGIGPDAPSTASCKLSDRTALLTFLADLDASLEKREPRFMKLSEGCLGSCRHWKSEVSSKSM